MAAPSKVTQTPRKTYSLCNMCIICGFSFIQTLKDSLGKEITKKYFDRKLKLTEERKKLISDYVGVEIYDVGNDTGVCQKCFRSVEKLCKLEKESADLKDKLKQSTQGVKENCLLSLPSPKRADMCKTKRMLRSPGLPQPTKKLTPLLPITCIQPIRIQTFEDLTKAEQPKAAVSVRRSLTTSFTEVLHGEVEVRLILMLYWSLNYYLVFNFHIAANR